MRWAIAQTLTLRGEREDNREGHRWMAISFHACWRANVVQREVFEEGDDMDAAVAGLLGAVIGGLGEVSRCSLREE